MKRRPSVVCLAFSGGLDTTYCALLLREEGHAVHAVTVDTGGFSAAEARTIAARAKAARVARFVFLDRRREVFEDYALPLIFGNVLRGGVYPLSVAAERAVQAKAVADYARRVGAVADRPRLDGRRQRPVPLRRGPHGPRAGARGPRADSRQRPLARGGVGLLRARAASSSRRSTTRYSVNEGLWGTTIGGGETHDPWAAAARGAFSRQHARPRAPKTPRVRRGRRFAAGGRWRSTAARNRVSTSSRALEHARPPLRRGPGDPSGRHDPGLEGPHRLRSARGPRADRGPRRAREARPHEGAAAAQGQSWPRPTAGCCTRASPSSPPTEDAGAFLRASQATASPAKRSVRFSPGAFRRHRRPQPPLAHAPFRRALRRGQRVPHGRGIEGRRQDPGACRGCSRRSRGDGNHEDHARQDRLLDGAPRPAARGRDLAAYRGERGQRPRRSRPHGEERLRPPGADVAAAWRRSTRATSWPARSDTAGP